jgi:hypothetical protein
MMVVMYLELFSDSLFTNQSDLSIVHHSHFGSAEIVKLTTQTPAHSKNASETRPKPGVFVL